jgi:hypothetical protein
MSSVILGFKITEFTDKRGQRLYDECIDYFERNDFGRIRHLRGQHREEDRFTPNSLLPGKEKLLIYIEVGGLFKICKIKDVSRSGFSIEISDLEMLEMLSLYKEDWYLFGLDVQKKKFGFTGALRYVFDENNILSPRSADFG